MADARQIATHCEAVKVAYVQTEKGYKVTFAIHPSEMPPELALAPIGTRVVLAVAEIATDGAGDAMVPPAPPESVPLQVKNGDRADKARQAFRDDNEMGQAARLAGMLRDDPEYQKWLAAQMNLPHEPNGDARIYAINVKTRQRYLLAVKSCSEIATDPAAFERWNAHRLSFEIAVGRAAAPR